MARYTWLTCSMLTLTRPLPLRTPPHRLDALSLPQPWGLQHLEVFILKVVSTIDFYLCVLKEPWRAKRPSIHRASKHLSCLGFLLFVKYGRGVVLVNTAVWEMISQYASPHSPEGASCFIGLHSSDLYLTHCICISIRVCVQELSWARLSDSRFCGAGD